MINRTTLIGLAAATFVLMVCSALIGQDNDFLWIVDDIAWFGFLACALALIVLSITVLVRAMTRGRGPHSGGA